MLQSMTGYGTGENSSEAFKWFVEIKTLNSKSIDISTRLSRELTSKELEIRNILQKKLLRGKVYINIEMQCTDPLLVKRNFNTALVKAYYEDISKITNELNLNNSDILRLIFSFSEIYEEKDAINIEPVWEKIVNTISDALDNVIQFRIQEGKSLKLKLTENADFIKKNLDVINNIKDDRIELIRTKLKRRVSELTDSINIDNDRLEQEVLFYIEKIDITEEIVRLYAHLEHFCLTLETPAPGKKLNFISQEIGREINTLGVKAFNIDIQKKVVDMKEELEKIKEQVLNVL